MVGSGSVGNLTGRIASVQEVFKRHGSESGHPDPMQSFRSDLTREKP